MGTVVVVDGALRFPLLETAAAMGPCTTTKYDGNQNNQNCLETDPGKHDKCPHRMFLLFGEGYMLKSFEYRGKGFVPNPVLINPPRKLCKYCVLCLATKRISPLDSFCCN